MKQYDENAEKHGYEGEMTPLKCDELTPIELECNMGKDINGVVHREPWKAYDIDEVDAVIAKLKAENKMLKEHIANGDVSRITWIDEAMELKAENERLKKCEIWMKQHFYCEEVIACESAKNRQLKRALWIARAYRAEARKNYWYARSCHEGDERLWSIDGSAVKYIGCIKRTNFDWLKVWSEVESKCLKKAGFYL